ncbi:hypothetical protein PoB_003102400 [Plakobranchus ocellatus]|uniref:DUF7869 domain-containing protein n=1 Tax=Plakobranchus ocellatus TaxID=259542 RepID=A0AAV4AA42_9GAST|nr:hypothetical protein PoB_003102400 [Plakobranchus ocellatus]
MNNFDDSYDDVQIVVDGRKKRANKAEHSREKVKRAKHSCGGKIPQISCQHDASKSQCWAEYLTGADLSLNQDRFYGAGSKPVKRERVTEEDRKKTRGHFVDYYLLTHQGRIKTCKATFCSVLGISQDRVTRVVKYFSTHHASRPENRGGRRNAADDEKKREAIKNHIQQFKCRASHYGRRDSPGRKYLPHELSISKMHRLFKEQNGLQVSFSLYYSVFCSNFNLGFGHPATDVCSTCTQLLSRVQNTSMSEEERKVMAAEFILHHRRARQFYNLLNEVNDTLTACFDVMENLVLPRTPIGQAYYSRHMYLYVLGVVIHHNNGTQDKQDIHLFTWLECQNRKDSNMVASALRSFLLSSARDELMHRTELRLFSDSCYGQNKNMNMMAMLLALKNQEYRHLRMSHTFPVRGHSFLPADRVFGRIEQDIRRTPTILLPEEYYDILRRHGNLHCYLEDWQCYDFKSATKGHIKQSRAFKLSEAKCVEITTSGLGVKGTYSSNFTAYPVLKKGKKWDTFRSSVLPPVSSVKEAKKTDTLKLLQELSSSQSVLDYYTTLLDTPALANTGSSDSDSD